MTNFEPAVGAEGHVSHLVLVPNVAGRREIIHERYPIDHEDVSLRGTPRLVGVEEVPDATTPRVPSGATACEWARVVSVDDGLVTAAGISSGGHAVVWRGVQVAREPVAVTAPGREDPAGHAFHRLADCPWGR